VEVRGNLENVDTNMWTGRVPVTTLVLFVPSNSSDAGASSPLKFSLLRIGWASLSENTLMMQQLKPEFAETDQSRHL